MYYSESAGGRTRNAPVITEGLAIKQGKVRSSRMSQSSPVAPIRVCRRFGYYDRSETPYPFIPPFTHSRTMTKVELLYGVEVSPRWQQSGGTHSFSGLCRGSGFFGRGISALCKTRSDFKALGTMMSSPFGPQKTGQSVLKPFPKSPEIGLTASQARFKCLCSRQ